MKKIYTAITGACLMLPLCSQASHCDGSTVTIINQAKKNITITEIYSSALFSANGIIKHLQRGQVIPPGTAATGLAYSQLNSWGQSLGYIKLNVDNAILDINYHFHTTDYFSGYFDCHSKATFNTGMLAPYTLSTTESSGKPADLTVVIHDSNK